MSKLNLFLRKFYNLYLQKKLKNKNITLIASNCNGGAILHDLNLPFNSPFVNLWLKPKDFLKFCENMNYYLMQSLRFIKEKDITYPVALLGGIKIYFQHYNNEKEALLKWEIRKQRIDMNHIYILFTDRDGCTYEDLQRFERLPFNKKAVLVSKRYPDILSAIYIPGFEHEDCVGMCMDFKNKFTSKKFYDSFDFISWFNGDQ